MLTQHIVQHIGSLFCDWKPCIDHCSEGFHLPQEMLARIRLVDNSQFKFGRIFTAKDRGLIDRAISAVSAWCVLNVRGYNADQLVACTIRMEGPPSTVYHQQRLICRLARASRGIIAGAESAKRANALTATIACMRDFLSGYGVVGDSFETSLEWQYVVPVRNAISSALDIFYSKCAESGDVQGKLFFSCRVSQSYHVGACMYFYVEFYGNNKEKSLEIYNEMEGIARDIACGM